MSQRTRRIYLVLTWLVILTLTMTPLAQADQAVRAMPTAPTLPTLLPPAGRNGLGMGQKENGNPADVPIQMMDGANVTNGNLLLSDTHFQFNGVGPTFGLQVAYNSQAAPTLAPMGRKWTHSLNVYLETTSNGLRLHKGDGETIDYLNSCRQDVNRTATPIDVLDVQLDAERWGTQLGDSFFDVFFDVQLPADNRTDIVDVQTVAAAFALPCTDVLPAYQLWTGYQADGVFSEIIADPAGPQLRTRDGLIYQFRPLADLVAPGYLASVMDRSGNGYMLTYAPSSGRLTQAESTSGMSLQFLYNTNGTLRQARDHTGRQVNYNYGGGDLASVNRFGAAWRTYGYTGANLLETDTDAIGKMTQYQYDGLARLISLQRPDTLLPQTYNYAVGQTDVTDPLGRMTTVMYAPTSSRISQVSNSATGMVILYDYDSRGNLQHLGGGDGNHYEYDSRGSLLRIQSAHPDPGATERLETRFTYDLCNNQTSVQDAQGAVTSNTYSATTCQLLSSTDPLGHTTQFINNGRGQPLQIVDTLGAVTQNTYDGDGNLTQAMDAGGNATTFTFDNLNRRVSETKPGGGATTFQYDTFDRQTRITAALGGVTQMVYDALGNLTAATDPDARTTEYTYDGRGNKLAAKDAAGHTTQYMVDAANRMVRMTDPAGQMTQVTYDGHDRPVQVMAPQGQTTTLAYDDARRARTITNAVGQTTTFQLDRIGRVTQVTNADGKSNVYQYNLAGNIIQVTDPLSRTETFAYDAAGRKLSETDALSQTTTYAYDAGGNVTALTNARGQTTNFSYDYAHRMTQVNDPLGGMTQLQYDALGHTTAVINAVGQTTQFVYDTDGRLTQATRATGGPPETTQIQYSPAGRQTGMIAPLGNSIQTTLDALGRVVQEVEGGYITLFQYDSRGRRTQMTDANGGVWVYGYDDLGRLTSSTDPLSRLTGYQYDLLGNLTDKIAPDGSITHYTYDNQNRITRTDYSDGSHDEQAYDAVGNATAARHFNGSGALTTETTFTYDARNRVVQTAQVISPTLAAMIGYEYDAVGNPTRKTYQLPGLAAPAQVDMTWDAKNRLTQMVRSDNGGTLTTTEGKTYDLEGRVTQSVFRKNGAAVGYAVYSYNGAGRLSQVRHCQDAGCTVQLSRLLYTYDANGNRLQETVEQGSQTTQLQYTYDPLTHSRLTRETRVQVIPPGPTAYDTQYTYDNVGNRVRREEISGGCIPGTTCVRTDTFYDAAHQIAQTLQYEGGGPPTQIIQHLYDGRGNLQMRQSVLGPAVMEQFAYDPGGRQTAYANPLAGDARTYAYDALGNKVLDCNGGGSNCTGYLYDGPNVVAEYGNATGVPTLSASYLFGQEIDEQVARIVPGSATVHFFLRDALGSTRQIIDQVGAVVKRYEYTAFGELYSESGTIAAPPNNLLFTGRPLDRTSNRYDFRTRTYDPTAGRFLQPDPIYEGLILSQCPACWQHPLELRSVMPLYTYVGNNPTTYNDPTGEQWWFWYPWWWGVGAWFYRPYGWWGWWYGPWGWFGLRWWWWRWWWPSNPWWGGWWWWQWRWWWSGWWWGWWGNFCWPWWWWGNWWWWPWWFGWGWWWWPWWWGGWWWPWWWFKWRGWWHWWWYWPFKWGWWCGWWWRWWWPWWWGGFWWPWWWFNWGGWGSPWWQGWGWWWWPWWWGGFWWPWWFSWGWWPWWGGRFWWPWWWGWRSWWWGTWWWGPWYWWGGWAWWPWSWGWSWWPWWSSWSLRPWWWGLNWIWWGWWRPWWWWNWWGAWWWWPSRWWWWFPLAAPLYRDVGDAPDSTNHYGASMVAYTGPPAVTAAFPTVYDPDLGAPYGPMHRYPRSDAWLGAWVSQENDADLIPDEDGPDWPNLDPPTPPGLSNRDDYDEGVTPSSINLPHCGLTSFTYTVTVAGGWRTRYVNVWFDWNRDAAWDDTMNCGGNNTAPEWAVQNLALTLGPGAYTLTTPAFRAWKPEPKAQWMRITLSEAPFALNSVGDGPAGGFRYGETEDYVAP
ncbi:RHS repeat-associated core domain-containing protein [Candidatus Amarolinea dominans]|uniref:RHS repeat-associated core domain-containing protein n=1 Tax=Candidatus Amarolinea dominans TaxID=3140696 RepID=UPI0031351B7B|nr:RHS repeat-associated core domain-containing protein [Anaerolineae bacterium]